MLGTDKGYRFENSTAEKKVDYLSKLLLKNEGAELLQLAKIQTRLANRLHRV